jgi:pyrimidine-nucleoside phosphorylase
VLREDVSTSTAKKPIQLLYNLLREGNSLSEKDAKIVEENNCTLPQLASLGVRLALKKRNDLEEVLLKKIVGSSPEVSDYLLSLTENKIYGEEFDKLSVLTKVNNGIELSDLEMEKLFDFFNEGKISDAYMATWLSIVCCKGLAEKNVVKLTEIMRDSGKIFDYRNSPELGYRKIIRRYPTGALSEKTALIMPSLIASLSEKYSIASNFLVAKSLSYTGGTWDKLNSLPNFYFPQQGEETTEIMKNSPHVVMSVTREDFNPLDRKLYQLRSVTGTVESIPLIVSSIASKHLAMPADFLLMDVRYGKGAFLNSRQEATEMSSLLMKILRNHMYSDYVLVDSRQPTGMGIGNELEIVEALKIMKSDKNKISRL